MKKLTYLLLALPLLLLVSCENNQSYSVTAKVNGQEWVSNGYAIAEQTSSGILVNANNDKLPTFVLLIADFANLGTYPIDSINLLQYGSGPSAFKYRMNRPGTLTISSVEPNKRRIAGTFSGTLFNSSNDSVIVTEGKFDLNYE